MATNTQGFDLPPQHGIGVGIAIPAPCRAADERQSATLEPRLEHPHGFDCR